MHAWLAGDGSNFENKIVLSIATRLKAEQYMIAKINEPEFVAGIDEAQTTKLLSKFKEKFPCESNAHFVDGQGRSHDPGKHPHQFIYV